MSHKRSKTHMDVDKWFEYDGKNRIELIHGGNARIATGAFGEVFMAIDLKGPWRLAVVKKITKTLARSGGNPWSTNSDSKPKLAKEVAAEVMALRVLSPHPCIVPFLGLLPDETLPGCLCLAFDYSPMDLQMLLDWRQGELMGKLPLDAVKTLSKDVFEALRHCHEHGILHRDVKPGNFLLSQEGRVQLCDFGLAKPCSKLLEDGANHMPFSNDRDTAASSNGLCTLWYRPPEVLLGGPANHPAVDMYSAGLVVAELVEGRPLFAGKSLIHQINITTNVVGTPSDQHWPEGRDLPDYQIISHISLAPQSLELAVPRAAECSNLMGFLSALIALDPKKRLSSSAAIDHAWFAVPLPAAMKHMVLADTFIPKKLRAPEVIFSSPQANQTTLAFVKQQGLGLAAARRSLLKPPQRQNMQIQQSVGDLLKSTSC